MKLPDWFRLSEDNWLKLELGEGQILPYHQIHYSEEILSRMSKQIAKGGLLTPSEKINLLRQHVNTVKTDKHKGHTDVEILVDLIGYYKKEKDPEVLLEVLDAIKWASGWARPLDGRYSFKDELKAIYRSLDGLKRTGDETISKQRAKSAVALMLLFRDMDEEVQRDAVEIYNQYGYNTPAFLRSAVFKGLDTYSWRNSDREKMAELTPRLISASLPEERHRLEDRDEYYR